MPARLEIAWLHLQHRALTGLGTLAQTLRPRHQGAPHLLTGERGEFEALFYLRRQGYAVVERRWRTPELRGDLDLIAWERAWDTDFLCFIEVKTRTARDITPASSSVDDAKRTMLRRMARAYQRTLPKSIASSPIRFDVLSVYLLGGKAECELVRGAFPRFAAPERNEVSAYGV